MSESLSFLVVFIGEVGGGFFLVCLMTRRRRPRASQEKKDRGGFFGISFVMDNCVLELGYEGQFIFIFAQKVT